MREAVLSGKLVALFAATASLTLFPWAARGDSPQQTRIADEQQTSEAAARGVRGLRCTDPVCGRIKNRDRQQWLRITNDWSQRENQRTWRFVKPGKTGRDANVKDVDGFFVGNGCRMTLGWIRTIGPGWYRIRNGQYIQVTDIRC
jgi:hypothetical protein